MLSVLVMTFCIGVHSFDTNYTPPTETIKVEACTKSRPKNYGSETGCLAGGHRAMLKAKKLYGKRLVFVLTTCEQKDAA